MNVEEWRPVAGFEEQYEVSSTGRVRRCARQLVRNNGRTYTVAAKELAQVAAGHRRLYRGVGFKVAPGTNRVFLVHRLVAAAFVPNPDNLPEVNHRDLNKANNGRANLEWTSGSGNQQHAASHGRFHGRTNPNARFKLQPEQADAIAAAAQAGENQDDIAARFGVSQALVSLIHTGKAWARPSEVHK